MSAAKKLRVASLVGAEIETAVSADMQELGPDLLHFEELCDERIDGTEQPLRVQMMHVLAHDAAAACGPRGATDMENLVLAMQGDSELQTKARQLSAIGGVRPADIKNGAIRVLADMRRALNERPEAA